MNNLPVQVDGSTSDGYHTFDELYEHRSALFVALMKSHPDISWRSDKHEDGTMFERYFIAGMHLPSGDITYHLPAKYYFELPGIKVLDNAPTWDGHTSNDVVERLLKWELRRD